MSSQARPRRPQSAESAELLPLDDAAEKITAFFSSLGDDSTIEVSVYAIDPKDRVKGRSFLFTLPSVAELTGPALMAQVLEKYGPGEYMAEGRDLSRKIAFCPRFTVGPLKPARAEIPDPRPSTPAPSSTPPELLAMLDRNTRALEALAARPAPSLVDQLKELAALREFIAPPAAAPQLDLTKIIEVVKDVLALRDTLGDAAGVASDSPLAVLARSLAPALTKIAERAVDQPALPAPRANGNAASSAQAAKTDTSAAPAEGDAMFVKVYVAELLRFAEQGLDPDAAAARVVGTLAGFPQSVVAGVLDWLNDEEIVAELAKVDARATQYADWLTSVVDKVLDAFDDDAGSAPEPPAVNGGEPAPANG